MGEAASSALGLYHLAFNVQDVEGYSMGELEDIAIGAKVSGLKKGGALRLPL